jgi:hypothetical protein
MGLRTLRWIRALRLSLALLASFLFSGTTNADETPSQRAERFFREALSLVEAGDYPAACPMFEESERLEHAIGTAFDLADCYEHTGKLAAALNLFDRVQREAKAMGKAERQVIAQARAALLAPSVANLQVTVADPAPAERVLLDGIELATPPPAVLPIDAGSHAVRASAPGRKPWSADFVVADGARQGLTVPPLEEEATAPGPNVGSVARTGKAETPPAPSWSMQKTLAVVAVGVGTVGFVVGTVGGIVSLIAHNSAQSVCPEDVYHFYCPTGAGVDDWTLATTSGT